MDDSATYKRGQVNWALWQTFSRHNAADPRRASIPAPFSTRVRKLQEFGVPLAIAERPGQAGVDAEYSSYHCFEVGVALAMQDNGLNQAEIGFFLRNLRPELLTVHTRIIRSASAPETQRLTARPSGGPLALYVGTKHASQLGDLKRLRHSEMAVYLTFRFIEIQEARNPITFDASDWDGKGRHPLFLKPKFHFGIASLATEFEDTFGPRGVVVRTVIELSAFATSLRDNLDRAPIARRGRPSK